MRFRTIIRPDGTTITEFADEAEDPTPTAEVLAERLRDRAVGSEVVPSMRAIRAIVARLRANDGLPPDVDHTLALIQQAANAALGAQFAHSLGKPIRSEYTLDVLAADAVLAGRATRGKRDVHVDDGTWQVRITRVLDEARADYAKAIESEHADIVSRTCAAIFGVVGRAPDAAMVMAALAMPPPRRGRPQGSTTGRGRGAPPARKLLDVYADILRGVGLAAGSTEALDKARRRRK